MKPRAQTTAKEFERRLREPRHARLCVVCERAAERAKA
jgi:hypothetical protein